jgi:N-ethylmaleimide reductase
MPTVDRDLFSSTNIGAMRVTNRIAMAPLTRSRADMSGVPAAISVEYYRQRATAGLIITEATNISRQGRGYAFTPSIYSDEHVIAWRRITEAVHGADGKIVCQLWHVGRISHVDLQENGAAPVAPSAMRPCFPRNSNTSTPLDATRARNCRDSGYRRRLQKRIAQGERCRI